MNWNRDSNRALKEFYKLKRDELLAKKLDIKSRVRADGKLTPEARCTYYSEWIYAALHMAIAVDRYETVPSIAAKMKIAENRVREAMEFLVENGLAEKKGSRYLHSVASLHIGKDQSWLKVHHTNWRLRRIESLASNSPDSLNYSSVISCGVDDRVRISEVLLKALQHVREIARESPSEEVYCYNLDFSGL